MSKRKPAIASKRARGQKMAARIQRNKQAIVRGPKDNPQRSVAAGSTEAPLKLQDSNPIVENRVAALKAAALKAAALPDEGSQKMRDNNPKKGFDFSLATTSTQAYQAKLLEMAQANIKFALEFSQRLATIRSPVELIAVIAEFTSRWIEMFGKYPKEMAAYPFWGIDASRELPALSRR
jgi:hypothetical protein